mgnify:CR=1 FL=1|tara:strand:+ start:844 stop:1056 length:213 start_codon:yes stop_codon:yes gene_type:complete
MIMNDVSRSNINDGELASIERQSPLVLKVSKKINSVSVVEQLHYTNQETAMEDYNKIVQFIVKKPSFLVE